MKRTCQLSGIESETHTFVDNLTQLKDTCTSHAFFKWPDISDTAPTHSKNFSMPYFLLLLFSGSDDMNHESCYAKTRPNA